MTRGLALFVGVALLGVAAGLAALGEPTSLDELGRFLRAEQGVDSWRPMNQASRHLASEVPTPLYQWIFFEQKIKFIYPPTSLLFLDAVRGLAPERSLQGALNAVSWGLVGLTALLVGWILDRSLSAAGRAATARERALRIALGAAGVLLFYPVTKAYSLGQMQVVVNAAFAGVVACWLAGRRDVAGALVVVMAAVKPQYGALLLWGVVRRERSFLVGALLAGVLVLGASLWRYGLASHLDYLSVASYVGRLGEAYWPNQTINGFLHRALGNGVSARWDPHVYPPYHAVVHVGTWVSTALLIGFACLGRARPPGSVFDAGAVVLAATIASPIAWEHHYGVLPPLFAVLLPEVARRYGTRGLAGLGAAVALASQYWHVLDRLTDTSWNALQSLLLAVGLGLLATLFVVRARDVAVKDS